MFNVSAVILAGGKSSRMGQNKSLMDYNGVPMIEHIYNQLDGKFDEIFIGANDTELYEFLNLNIVKDQKENCGPLMGIMSCVAKSANDWSFITACDIPEMNIEFIEQMISESNGYDIVVPVSGEDKHETLYALYNKSIIGTAEELLNCGKRRVKALFKDVKVKYIPMPKNDWYHNLNTMEDYKDIKK